MITQLRKKNCENAVRRLGVGDTKPFDQDCDVAFVRGIVEDVVQRTMHEIFEELPSTSIQTTANASDSFTSPESSQGDGTKVDTSVISTISESAFASVRKETMVLLSKAREGKERRRNFLHQWIAKQMPRNYLLETMIR